VFVSAIIAAGGRGTRAGAGEPKQLLEIDGVPMLQRAVDTFVRAASVNEIIVSIPSDLAHDPPSYLRNRSKPLHVVAGGVRRQDSVANAFERVSAAADIVVVHDAARPFATEALIARTVLAAAESGAASAALPASDTVKEAAAGRTAGQDPTVERTLPRERIFLAQTPQAFRREVLRDAIALARRTGIDVTDEAALAERAGHAVRLVMGEAQNVKITTVEDLRAARAAVPGEADRSLMRIGTGYDLHRLVDGRPFILAGVRIPFDKGPFGHSDADVLCHAISDAVLGAGALDDIGRHFPATDDRWRGAAGLDLLARAIDLVRSHGFIVINVDAVVIAERPRLAAYVPAIRSNLARTLNVAVDAVSVKGKTNEGLGELGRGEAIACHAVALLTKTR
jgi:2-C-methyl-D-erythritol 4-phosphate cytidylyltransferase/2-C-methyl-D-erythritol 2,4-cyclodiphosphate synthase